MEDCNEFESNENLFILAPYDKELKKMWDICLGSIHRRLKATDRICRKHFNSSDVMNIITVSKLSGFF